MDEDRCWKQEEKKLVKGRMFHVKHPPFVRVCRLLMDGMECIIINAFVYEC